MKQRYFESIEFSDSEIMNIEFNNRNELNVNFKSHDACWKIKFEQTIEFIYNSNNQIIDLYELKEVTSFFKDAIEREYEISNPQHTYREYQFLDANNHSVIRIISESVQLLDYNKFHKND